MANKFKVLRELFGNVFSTNNQEQPRKTFIVVNESSVRRGSSPSGKLSNISQTRPQKCPLCCTEEARQPGNIFRTSEEKWGCKACGHEW